MHAITPSFILATLIVENAEVFAQLFEALSVTGGQQLTLLAVDGGAVASCILLMGILLGGSPALIRLRDFNKSGTPAHAPYAQPIEHSGPVPACSADKQ